MDSKDFKQLILSKIYEGEKMEDILAEITATANEIEAEAKKNKSNDELFQTISDGSVKLIADLAFDSQPLDERDIMLIILTWLHENINITKLLGPKEDLTEVVDKGIAELKDMLNMANVMIGLREEVAKKCDNAKTADKKNCDPMLKFLKEFDLL